MPPETPYDVVIVAPNAALDSYYELESLAFGAVNRAARVTHTAGGKGHNMARALTMLGGRALSVGTAAGDSGRFVERQLTHEGIASAPLWTEGETRRCNTLITPSATTVVLETGQLILPDLENHFIAHVMAHARSAPTVALTGSLPNGFASHTYAHLAAALRDCGRIVALDAAGAALIEAVQAGVHLLKVNRDEYSASFGAWEAAQLPQHVGQHGLEALVITDGAAGAFVADADRVWHVRTPVDVPVSTAGAGDSFMAAFLLARQRGSSLADSACWASAAAAASVKHVICGCIRPEALALCEAKTELTAL